MANVSTWAFTVMEGLFPIVKLLNHYFISDTYVLNQSS